jgi:hypothetical protein
MFSEDRALYLTAVNVLYFFHTPLGRAEQARQIVEHAIARLQEPGATGTPLLLPLDAVCALPGAERPGHGRALSAPRARADRAGRLLR